MQDNGTALQQKCHQLVVYKVDHKKYNKENYACYLTLPSRTCDLTTNSKPSAPGLSLLPKDFVVIETNLCSTKLTQDGKQFFFGFSQSNC